MKNHLVLLGSLCLLFGCELSAQTATYMFDTTHVDEIRMRRQFERLDLTPLKNEIQKRRDQTLSQDELRDLAERNFSSLYSRKLDRRRLFRDPDPQRVVEKIIEIMRSKDAISKLIRRGRIGLVQDQQSEANRRIVQKVSDHAEKIKDLFEGYFIETRKDSYEIWVPENEEKVFTHYIVQATRIDVLLENALHDYFFDPTPHLMDVSEFRNGNSITVLVKSLSKLGKLVEKRLKS